MGTKPGYGGYLFLALLLLFIFLLRNLLFDLYSGERTLVPTDELSGPEIDINSAQQEELVLVPGIGESLAREIVLKRKEIDGFDGVEDLMSVKGIGRAKFDRFRAFIDVKKAPQER